VDDWHPVLVGRRKRVPMAVWVKPPFPRADFDRREALGTDIGAIPSDTIVVHSFSARCGEGSGTRTDLLN